MARRNDKRDGSAAVSPAQDMNLADLEPFLGSPVPPFEAAMWAAMPTDRRAKAMQRMKTLSRWESEDHLSPAVAAADAGVSLNRWFEMAKRWRENRSLASLGTFARSSRRTDPREIALREIVADVLGPYPTGSVRRMATDLGARFVDVGGAPVGQKILRRVVEDELRRRGAERQLGNEIQFDCGACSVLRPDDTPFTLFAVIDRGSQILLGGAFGGADDSRAGYAEASRDALRRLGDGSFDGLPWLPQVARMELVAGLDVERWLDLRREMREIGVVAPVEPSVRPDRFGRYLRPAIGERLGRIDMWYGRTVPDRARDGRMSDRSPRLAPVEAAVLLAAQIDIHNAERRDALSGDVGANAPDDLLRALRHLSTA